METSADVQERASYYVGQANVSRMAGDAVRALAAAEIAFEARETIGITHEAVKQSFVTAVEAALELEELDKAEELLALAESLPPGSSSQFLQAQSSRFRAQLSGRRGDADETERRFKRATGLFRELAMPFYMAVTLLEYSEWLRARGRADDAEPLLAEAREIFERLEATPWIERAARAAGLERQTEVVS